MSTVIYISPLAYLRSMIAIAWSAFRHPFTTTVVDLVTGKYLEQEKESHSEAISQSVPVDELQEPEAVGELTAAIRQLLAQQEREISRIFWQRSELLEWVSHELAVHGLAKPQSPGQLSFYVKVGDASDTETLLLGKSLPRQGLVVVLGEGFVTATVTPWGAASEPVGKRE